MVTRSCCFFLQSGSYPPCSKPDQALECLPPEFCLTVAQGHWPPKLCDPPLQEGVPARRKELVEQPGMRGYHILGRGPWVTGRMAKD